VKKGNPISRFFASTTDDPLSILALSMTSVFPESLSPYSRPYFERLKNIYSGLFYRPLLFLPVSLCGDFSFVPKRNSSPLPFAFPEAPCLSPSVFFGMAITLLYDDNSDSIPQCFPSHFLTPRFGEFFPSLSAGTSSNPRKGLFENFAFPGRFFHSQFLAPFSRLDEELVVVLRGWW